MAIEGRMNDESSSGARAGYRRAEDDTRPTRPSRPRADGSGEFGLSPTSVPSVPRPFCFVPTAIERAVDVVRPRIGDSAVLVASRGPSVVASAREEDVTRLVVGLLLEAAGALPRNIRDAEVRIAGYSEGDEAVIEVAVVLRGTDVWCRPAVRALFVDERLGPRAWRDVALTHGLRLEVDVRTDPTLRLHLPLAAR
jgi:hypothetical protein